jgi:hypothetical protein
MLKAVIDKIEDVAEAFRGEYTAGEGGKFFLQLTGLEEGTGHPAVGELVRAKKREADAATARTAEAMQLKADLAKVKEDLHNRLKGKVDQSDLEALEKSYQQKLADAATETTTVRTSLGASLREVLVDREARALAVGIALDANAAELLAESIQRRLSVEITSEGKAVARVLGIDGKPSAASLDDLKKEIVATPKYHGLLLASKASGSGAASGGSASGASPGKVDWLRGKPSEIAEAAAKANPLLGG